MKRTFTITILVLIHLSLYAQNIFRTACQGNLARLDSMLAHTSISETDHRGRSLAHWAVACDQKEVFESLVKKGMNINAEDDQNKTPMHMAVRFENDEFFDLLVKGQSNGEWTDHYGASLLESAVLKKSTAFISKLVENGVDINSTNKRGSTALEIAQRTKANEISAFLLSKGADQGLVRTFEMNGKYMGQSEPGIMPQVFAPNFISTEEYEFGSVFNSEGTEFYYGVDVGNRSEIRFSQLIHGKWSEPEVILSHDVYGYNDPFLSTDENKLYFISRRALDGSGPPKDDHDIWYVERKDPGWSEPINAGTNINSSGNEYYISFTREGTMYFSSNVNAPEDRRENDMDIYYSKFVDGKFQKAISLGSSINTEDYEADVFVDPEEEYVIFCSTRSGGLGRGDLYISFKRPDGTWTKSINMGKTINTRHHELCPFVTSDGKYFFYTSNEDIVWISTEVFQDLKVKSR